MRKVDKDELLIGDWFSSTVRDVALAELKELKSLVRKYLTHHSADGKPIRQQLRAELILKIIDDE